MWEFCSKCGKGGALTKVNVGTENAFIKTESYFCWKCFNEEFEKTKEEESLYQFKK